MPASGIIVPVVNIPETSQDYTDYMKGLPINTNRYLQHGVLRHPDSVYLWEVGNAVIAGHSSYYKTSVGRYKTAFKYLPIVDIGEEIWVYKKYNGVYKLLRYKVNFSGEISADDTASLENSGDMKEITLYTCVPIGTSKNRWVVKWIGIEN